MVRYRIDVSYDGGAYAGWQIQPNGVTVQQKIEEAIGELCGESAKVHGSGRTDQGVHARCQVAHFDLRKDAAPNGLRQALNAVLPADIRVLKAIAVERTFHARRSATSKQYRYFIWNAEFVPPFLRRYRTHVRNRLDVSAMRGAAECLQGRHDFAAFTANPNRTVASTVRTLSRLSVTRRGREIVVIAEGEGFLYRMVRSLAGWLIRVGEGAVTPLDTRKVLASRRRTAGVPTAPPEGLFLWNVKY